MNNGKLSKLVRSDGFKAFRAACLAIVIGLIFGFFVMLAASPAVRCSRYSYYYHGRL